MANHPRRELPNALETLRTPGVLPELGFPQDQPGGIRCSGQNMRITVSSRPCQCVWGGWVVVFAFEFQNLDYFMSIVQLVPPLGSNFTGFMLSEQNPRLPLVPVTAGVPVTP